MLLRLATVATAALLAAGAAHAQTINVATAGDQNMVDYVNDYLGPLFEKTHPGVKVVAITDPVAKNRANHKARHAHLAQAAEYGDYRQMLRKEDLTAVVIASPHTLHYEQIMASLKRGLHVLVEKPMTASRASTPPP